MTEPIHFYNYSKDELTQLLTDWGLPRHTSDQVFQWLYKKKAKSFEAMTDLSKSLREELAQKASLSGLKLQTKQISQDGTAKYLWELPPDEKGQTAVVESVLIASSIC